MASQAVKIIDGGKLIIPAAFRRKLGIEVGDTVIIELDEDGLHVRSLTSAVRLAQTIVGTFRPDDAPDENALSQDHTNDPHQEAEHD